MKTSVNHRLVAQALLVLPTLNSAKRRAVAWRRRINPNPFDAMKTGIIAICYLLSAIFELAHAQGTAFTYQGQLQNNGSPASGTYNLTFTLFNTNITGVPIAGPVTNSAVAITNGLFTVIIDFGAAVWNGATNWLQVGVETNGGSTFATLAPRQQLTPAPYAIYAEGANAAGLSGTIPMASLNGIYGGAVNLTNAGNSFSGNGAGLTNVNAATLGGLSATNFWQTSGNSGTSPTNGNFLGTADLQPIEIRVGGLRGWRVEPDPRGDGAANLIGGYISNAVQQPGSGGDFIGDGGYVGGFNTIYSNSSGNFIGAGSANQIGPNVNNDFIGAGGENTIQSPESVIVGGASSTIYGNAPYSTIGGGLLNQIYGDTNDYGSGVIAGGYTGTINSNSWNSFIGGGGGNTIGTSSDHSVIVGGYGNLATGSGVFIGGGGYDGTYSAGNQALANASTIGGGLDNTIESGSAYSVIGGGRDNTVPTNASAATIGGGAQNSASGSYSTVPGGVNNNASGDRSFAAGDGALAAHYGSFVLADASGGFFSSTATNQFSIRAEGGVRLVTAGAGVTLDGQAVVPSGNYVFAYSIITLQTVTTPSNFQDATFNNDAQLNGWMHTLGSSQYFCTQTGLYLVQYTAEAYIADSMSMRGALNSIEIPGSQAYAFPNNFGPTVVISKSFLARVNSGSFLTIQFTGNSAGDHLQGGGSGSFQPSISLTITRIQ